MYPSEAQCNLTALAQGLLRMVAQCKARAQHEVIPLRMAAQCKARAQHELRPLRMAAQRKCTGSGRSVPSTNGSAVRKDTGSGRSTSFTNGSAVRLKGTIAQGEVRPCRMHPSRMHPSRMHPNRMQLSGIHYHTCESVVVTTPRHLANSPLHGNRDSFLRTAELSSALVIALNVSLLLWYVRPTSNNLWVECVYRTTHPSIQPA